jgi:hypothetical protein
MPHSWIEPNDVCGQGPAWQIVVLPRVPQQTWPGRQPSEVMHVAALLVMIPGPP